MMSENTGKATPFTRIPNCPGYAVNESGQVWSEKSNKVLSPATSKKGYLYVNLSLPGGSRNHYTHRLVLSTFRGACPSGMEGCHFDGNKKNNSLNNLRWDYPQNNAQDNLRLGAYKPPNKYPDEVRGAAISLRKSGQSYGRIAKELGVSIATVWNWDHE